MGCRFAVCRRMAHFRVGTPRYVGVRVTGSSTLTSLPAVTDRDTDQNSDHSSARRPPAATDRPGAIRDCSSDADCDGELGETCVRLYDGCRRGQCMCDPATGPPPPARTDGDRPRPWDVVAGDDRIPPSYCHHVAQRMFDKLDAKCDLC